MPLKWTNKSFVPSSGVMKPYPFSLLNHLTVPVAMLLPPFPASYHRPISILRCPAIVSRIVRKHNGVPGLAPGVQCIVDGRFLPDLLVVILSKVCCEPIGDRPEPGGFGFDRKVRGDICPMHDAPQELQRRVFQAVLQKDRLEAATPVHMTELDTLHIVRDGSGLTGDSHDLPRGHVEELRVGIDKPPDEPGAGDPVNVGVLSCNPPHAHLRLCVCLRNLTASFHDWL